MLGTYTYKAFSENGILEEGQIRATSTQEAFEDVKKMGLMPQKIVPLADKENFDFKGAISKLKKEKYQITKSKYRNLAFGLSIIFIIILLITQIIPISELIKVIIMYICFVGVIGMIFMYFWKN